ncbi:putative transcription factor B3-Domain family [Helianthus anomalus]
MDSTKRAHSFITFIDKEEPVFLVIPNDFATILWGDKIPYYKTVEIRDGDNLRMKYKDGVLIKAVGQFTFEVSCFKELVCQNSYLTAQVETELRMSLMPNKFFNDFYAQNFKGGMATVYFGERFWNVKLEEASENGCFKAGWRKVVEEVPLYSDYFLVFTRLDSKTFDVSVFDPDTGTESTADADVIVESMLPADVSEYDLERKPKGVKGKSKLDVGQVLITKNEYHLRHILFYIS